MILGAGDLAEVGARLSEAEKVAVRSQLSQWATPEDLIVTVDRIMDRIGSATLFNQAGLEMLRDGFIAGHFARSTAAEAVRLVPDTWPDFQVRYSCGQVEAFEAVQADRPGRALGLEYRSKGGDQIEDDPVEAWHERAAAASDWLKAAVSKKLSKRYRGLAGLVLYLNMDEYGVAHRETVSTFPEATRAAKDAFESVWVLWKSQAHCAWQSPARVAQGPGRLYRPWVGDRHERGHRRYVPLAARVLVLGESAYGGAEWERRSDYPTVIVRDRVFDRAGGGTFFHGITRLFADLERSDPQCEAVWNEIAFTEYVQAPIAEPGQAPTRVQLQNAASAFERTLEELRPTHLIVVSRRLWDGMLSDGSTWLSAEHAGLISSERATLLGLYRYDRPWGSMLATGVYHPRWPTGFQPDILRPLIARFLQMPPTHRE